MTWYIYIIFIMLFFLGYLLGVRHGKDNEKRRIEREEERRRDEAYFEANKDRIVWLNHAHSCGCLFHEEEDKP